jgi:hypothetical protein
MKIKYVDLLSGNLPPGFRDYHEVMRVGTMSRDGQYIEIGEEPTSKEVNWPAWAKALGTQRIEGEVGVGDTAQRLLHSPGVRILADGIVAGLALFGRKCGCTRRQNEWNLKYSYAALNPLRNRDSSFFRKRIPL